LLLAFEKRPVSLSFLSGLSSATVAMSDRQDARRRRAEDVRRAVSLSEKKQGVVQQAKSQVVQAIALHRSGEEGKDVVTKVTNADDPVFQLVREVFKNVGVPGALVEDSLKDWTKGVNVMEIGRRWQEKGIDIPAVVRNAEGQGLPVRRLMQEKDTMR